ncbi:hotdog domain-containing protein [Sphingomonas sp. CA1-15]|uniref:Hotdog domain-containing protein n=2 Tax=Sphingomonas immobilis TaxID=3063997 RepID=A0ABT9A4Z6_9SPHN|nr:hotdog domain-containing protein [Sphingomonas sp. CA1-15]MDO7844414.1 hotdog domain-containing protein [Sphingomonas sp. CA1-15]
MAERSEILAPETAPAIRATAMAADANPYGNIFVGWLMGQMALAAGSVASRHSGAQAPVVAADAFSFTAPVRIGDEVSFHADIVATGRSSMTVAVAVWRRDRHGEGTERAAQGRFTLVAMGEDGRPRAITNATLQIEGTASA